MEQNNIKYVQIGDYFIPDLTLPAGEEQQIGIWGQRHLRYIKQHKRSMYLELKATAKLNGYLADIDREATELFSRLVKELAQKEGVTEELKATDQMLWVQRMNNIRERVTEIVNSVLIFK